MPTTRGHTDGWVCPTCRHHNPTARMQCRKCRRTRPLGS
jgi:hypothetical protein